MFRQIADFEGAWAYESESTLKILRGLTEASLAQPVAPGRRTLGRLAWHVVISVSEMARHAGLAATGPDDKAPQPSLAEMIRTYEESARGLGELVRARWSDAMLSELIPIYGEQWTRGQTLGALIAHQTHHRGQMTVLMRQAGLAVPGIYGPAKEEWAAMGMDPQD